MHDFRLFNELDLDASWDATFYMLTEHHDLVREFLPSRVHAKHLGDGAACVFWVPRNPKKRTADRMMLADADDETDEAYRDGGTESGIGTPPEDDGLDDNDASGHEHSDDLDPSVDEKD